MSEHNIRRAKHENTEPLEYSIELEQVSQEWADHLIQIGTIKHDYSSAYGENIFAGWGVFVSDEVAIKKSLVGW